MDSREFLDKTQMNAMIRDIGNPKWGENIANHLQANEDFIFTQFFLALLDGCRQQLKEETVKDEELKSLGVVVRNRYERQSALHKQLHKMITDFCITQNDCNPIEALLLITFELISVTKFFLKTTDLGKEIAEERK